MGTTRCEVVAPPRFPPLRRISCVDLESSPPDSLSGPRLAHPTACRDPGRWCCSERHPGTCRAAARRLVGETLINFYASSHEGIDNRCYPRRRYADPGRGLTHG